MIAKCGHETAIVEWHEQNCQTLIDSGELAPAATWRGTYDTGDDRQFFLSQREHWANELHAHTLTHEGPLAHTIPGAAPAGPHCQICVDIERNLDHWAGQLQAVANG